MRYQIITSLWPAWLMRWFCSQWGCWPYENYPGPLAGKTLLRTLNGRPVYAEDVCARCGRELE